MTAGPSAPGGRGRARRAGARQVGAHTRQGWGRVQRALVPVLLAGVAAGLAWFVAHTVLGHEFPFFAPVSAWVALGFSADRRLRRVGELAVGVAVGVLLGEALVHLLGAGPVQIGLVLAVAALVARFVDRGDLLTVQAGVQAIVIVGLPAAQAGSPLGRWADALVGGAIALGVAALSPQDPRRRVRSLAQEGLGEVAAVLGRLARALGSGNEDEVEDALLRGRASQPLLDTWQSVALNARQSARLSPVFRRYGGELAELERSAVLADRAMRNARVLVRRSRAMVAGDHDAAALARLVAEVGEGAAELAAERGSGATPSASRERLTAAAALMDPAAVSAHDLQVQGLLLLLRSLVVDLLEASGVPGDRAVAALPEL